MELYVHLSLANPNLKIKMMLLLDLTLHYIREARFILL